MTDAPDETTRTAVTERISAHVLHGWPKLKAPVVHHRGQFCYVAAVLPGSTNPVPLVRLEYFGSADKWGIAEYHAEDDRYTETDPSAGTPEESIDLTLPHYAGAPVLE
jgi:hypothetical protein